MWSSIRCGLIRLLYCPVPFLPRATPFVGGKSLLDLFLIALILVCSGFFVTGSTGSLADLLGLIVVCISIRNNYLLTVMGLSFEHMLIWHKTLGLGAVIAGAVHGWGQSSLSGVGLIVCMSLMPVSYMALRLVDFNYFYFAHILLYFVIIFFAVLHGATMFALSGIVYGAELALRTFLMNRHLTATAHPIDPNHVLLTFPKPFLHKAGQYCFVAIKEVSMIEIHPFSICSSPGEGEMAFCIKNSGDWTAKLMQVVGSVPRSIDISVDGRYGGQTVDFHNVDTYRVVLLICGGVGFTSTLSLFNDLAAHARKCKVNRKVRYLLTLAAVC